MRHFTVGTRGSALALWQTRHVTQLLSSRTQAISEKVITTQGDVNLAQRLVGSLEKGFFTQELEAALRAGEIDWAVHSLKDLPTRSPPGLVLGATLERAAASDVLLLRPEALDSGSGRQLPVKPGARIGSSSLRREAMLKHFAPWCEPRPLRGNVPTRIEKLKAGQYEGILLAAAGVRRLNLDVSDFVAFELNPRRWVCAPGQGAIAVQCRSGDEEVENLLGALHHAATARATALERDFLRVLEGGCTTPFGCYVEGPDAWLGLATDTGWHVSRVRLPDDRPEPAWFEQALDSLKQSSEEQTHEWIARRL